MGNSESTSQPNNINNKLSSANPEQIKSEIQEQVYSELRNILDNLEHSKHKIGKNSYNARKNQIDEFRLKFAEFHKLTQINDGMIKRLSTANAELENTLGEYKKELLKYEREKEEFKEQFSKKEEDLQSKFAQLQRSLFVETDTKKVLQEKIKEYKDKTQKYEEKIIILNVANAELQNKLEELKKDVLKRKTEDDNFNKKQDNFLKECLDLKHNLLVETNEKKKMESDLRTLKDKCEKYELDIKSFQNDLDKKKCTEKLRKQAKHELDKMHNQQALYDTRNKQAENLKNLQEKLSQTQENLQKERRINQEGSYQLEMVKQYSENLRRQLQEKEMHQQETANRFKMEMDQLQNQLSKVKINLGKSRRDVRQLEDSRKRMQIDLEQKQKEVDDNLKELVALRIYYMQALGSTYKQEIEGEVDKLGFDFISSCQNNLNSEIGNNPKQAEIKHNYDKEIKKYEKTIKELKDELRSSDMKFQSEEKHKKEVEGKLFLVEKNFHSLKIFCSRELKDIKDITKKAINQGGQENQVPLESAELVSLEDKAGQSNSETVPEEEQLNEAKVFEARFCTNQETEMNSLHKEFETIFTRIK